MEFGEVSSPSEGVPGNTDQDRQKEIHENDVAVQVKDENLPIQDIVSSFNFSLLLEEFSMKTLWHKREWGEMGTTAAKNLIFGVIPSYSDLYSDVQLFIDYFWGSNYTKTVNATNHEYVNNNDTNCTLDFRTSIHSWAEETWKEESVSYTYSCFEVDPIYAWFTFAFIFALPGLAMFATCLQYAWATRSTIAFCLSPIIGIFYPFVLLLFKAASVFQNGKQFKKFSNFISRNEGIGEAVPQLCVQLYIICSRFDRNPSPIQCFSLVSSAISFNLPMIEAFNETKPPANGFKEEILRIAKFLPLFLSTTLSRVLSIVIVCILLKYNAVFFYGSVYVVILILGLIPTTRFIAVGAIWDAFTIHNFIPSPQIPMTNEQGRIKKRFHMLFWSILNTITLLCFLILANSSDVKLSSSISGMFGVEVVEHSWRKIPIVANIVYINSIITFTLASGVISLILFYFQVE